MRSFYQNYSVSKYNSNLGTTLEKNIGILGVRASLWVLVQWLTLPLLNVKNVSTYI